MNEIEKIDGQELEKLLLILKQKSIDHNWIKNLLGVEFIAEINTLQYNMLLLILTGGHYEKN